MSHSPDPSFYPLIISITALNGSLTQELIEITCKYFVLWFIHLISSQSQLLAFLGFFFTTLELDVFYWLLMPFLVLFRGWKSSIRSQKITTSSQMKQVRYLSESEQITLSQAITNHPKHRCRLRAHVVLTSYRGFSIKDMSRIFDTGSATISSWLDQWLNIGIAFLFDAKRTGRQPIYNDKEALRIKELVDQEPHQLKKVQSIIAAETGKSAHKSTIKRVLKKN